jgi:hypothetical protein
MSVGIGGFTTGIQRSWTITDNTTGLQVPFGGDVIDITASPEMDHITIKPISTQGYAKHKTNRVAWKGSMTIARTNPDADLFEAAQEALYHQTGTQKYFTILEDTVEEDGSISTMQYTEVELFMDDSGMARTDSAVEIKLGMNAASKQPV